MIFRVLPTLREGDHTGHIPQGLRILGHLRILPTLVPAPNTSQLETFHVSFREFCPFNAFPRRQLFHSYRPDHRAAGIHFPSVIWRFMCLISQRFTWLLEKQKHDINELGGRIIMPRPRALAQNSKTKKETKRRMFTLHLSTYD